MIKNNKLKERLFMAALSMYRRFMKINYRISERFWKKHEDELDGTFKLATKNKNILNELEEKNEI